MDPLFERRELSRKVHIQSKYIQKNMAPSILAQLKTNIEGKCTSEGYIHPDSITLLTYSLGRTNYTKGGLDYDVSFQTDICLPHPGQIFKSSVELRTKIGIHSVQMPLKILIPRDLHIGNPEFDTLEIGQEFEFEVIGQQFKQQDTSMVVVGRLRTALKPAPLQPLLHAVTEVNIPTTFSNPTPDEKIITVNPTEQPPKKTRRLKKPTTVEVNGSIKTGANEGTT